jgi:hypothetical protein
MLNDGLTVRYPGDRKFLNMLAFEPDSENGDSGALIICPCLTGVVGILSGIFRTDRYGPVTVASQAAPSLGIDGDENAFEASLRFDRLFA